MPKNSSSPLSILKPADKLLYLGRWVMPTIACMMWMEWPLTKDALKLNLKKHHGNTLPLVDGHIYIELCGTYTEIAEQVYGELVAGNTDLGDKIIATAEQIKNDIEVLLKKFDGRYDSVEFIKKAFDEHRRLSFPWIGIVAVGDGIEKFIQEFCYKNNKKFEEITANFPELRTSVSEDQKRLYKFKQSIVVITGDDFSLGAIKAKSPTLAQELADYQKETEYIGTHHFWGESRFMDKLLGDIKDAELYSKSVVDALPRELESSAQLASLCAKWRLECAYIYAKLSYKMRPALQLISDRLDCDYGEIIYATPEEIMKELGGESVIDINQLRDRKKCYGVIADSSMDNPVVVTGDDCTKMKRLLGLDKSDLSDVTEIRGQIGSKGLATGKVIVLLELSRLAEVKEGMILVTPATTPGFVPAMKKASAFVTDQGGITSHAAIVAREMKKPCIIGTKIATQVLKDGDKVEVDANKGIVRIIK